MHMKVQVISTPVQSPQLGPKHSVRLQLPIGLQTITPCNPVNRNGSCEHCDCSTILIYTCMYCFHPFSRLKVVSKFNTMSCMSAGHEGEAGGRREGCGILRPASSEETLLSHDRLGSSLSLQCTETCAWRKLTSKRSKVPRAVAVITR